MQIYNSISGFDWQIADILNLKLAELLKIYPDGKIANLINITQRNNKTETCILVEFETEPENINELLMKTILDLSKNN